jgi:hypothetical protein
MGKWGRIVEATGVPRENRDTVRRATYQRTKRYTSSTIGWSYGGRLRVLPNWVSTSGERSYGNGEQQEADGDNTMIFLRASTVGFRKQNGDVDASGRRVAL